MSRRVVLLLNTLSLCAVFACGGDEHGFNVDTGLPAQQKLSEVSKADAPKICQVLRDGLAQFPPAMVKQAACIALAQGIADEGDSPNPQIDVAGCEMFVTKCENNELSGDGANLQVSTDIDCDADAVSANLVGCDATIADYETCVEATLRGTQSVIDSASCAQPIGGSAAASAVDQACLPIESQCPGLVHRLTAHRRQPAP